LDGQPTTDITQFKKVNDRNSPLVNIYAVISLSSSEAVGEVDVLKESHDEKLPNSAEKFMLTPSCSQTDNTATVHLFP